MLDGWDRGRKGVADRQAGRGVGQRVVGVLQLPQLSLAGHSRWGNQALLPGNSPRPTAVLRCYRGCSHGTAHRGGPQPCSSWS